MIRVRLEIEDSDRRPPAVRDAAVTIARDGQLGDGVLTRLVDREFARLVTSVAGAVGARVPDQVPSVR